MIKNAFMGSERMIKIAVVEDNKKDQAILTEYLKKFSARFEIETFDSAVLFLTDYKPKYDIVFMDIEMPYLDGMSAAAKLRQVDNCACLIFVTNLAQYAIKGYEVAAFDYIVKPLTYANFAMKMTRILTHIDTKTQKEVLVRTSDGIVRVDVSDIMYVEIAAHKITRSSKRHLPTIFAELVYDKLLFFLPPRIYGATFDCRVVVYVQAEKTGDVLA